MTQIVFVTKHDKGIESKNSKNMFKTKTKNSN